MQIAPAEVPSRDVYAALIGCIVPRPIAWVATRAPDGGRNLAPFSFFTGVASRPATLCFSVAAGRGGRLKDTARNILAGGDFVVNVVPAGLAEAMVATSGEHPYGVDEGALAGLETVPGDRVAADRVVGSPVQLECSRFDVVPIHDGAEVTARLFIGRVELIHIADGVLDAEGRVDPRALDPLARLGGRHYARLGEVFAVRRPEV